MKKSTVIFIFVISIVFFGTLIFYGLKNARNIEVEQEHKHEAPKILLKASHINKEINFNKGISEDIWNTITPTEIKLTYQVMALPWGKSLISPIFVKAFHNDKDIYFYISWKDETMDNKVEINTFPDAVGIMFPLGENVQPSTLMMGFMGKANIWQWKASQDEEFWSKVEHQKKAYVDLYYPFEKEELLIVSKKIPKSAVNDLTSILIGTITPKQKQNVSGKGFWKNGIWKVVFKRSLQSNDVKDDAMFISGKKILCAFAVWDGANKDRGGRKSISKLVEFEVLK